MLKVRISEKESITIKNPDRMTPEERVDKDFLNKQISYIDEVLKINGNFKVNGKLYPKLSIKTQKLITNYKGVFSTKIIDIKSVDTKDTKDTKSTKKGGKIN